MIDSKNNTIKLNFVKHKYRNLLFVAISILFITQIFFIVPNKELYLSNSKASMEETSYKTSLILRSLFFN